jgi:V/A-type H+-transporting ATPase subunit I
VFNLVINVLGSFIHAGRLQFVEFFTKFFEGGGRPFKPLTRVSENVSLSD